MRAELLLAEADERSGPAYKSVINTSCPYLTTFEA
jgi:hypothetical protein